MAEERDSQVAAAYRELGAEEPPRRLDEAILAASRRPPRHWTQRWAVPLSLAAVVVLSVTITLQVQHEAPELESAAAPPRAAAPARSEAQEEAPLKLKPDEQLRQRARAAAEKPEARRAEPKAFADAAPAAPARSTAPAAGPDALASRNDVARLEQAHREAARSADSGRGSSALGQVEERTARDAEAAARAHQAGALFAKRPEQAPAAKPAAPPPAEAAAAPPAAAAPAQVAKLSGETPEREFERIAQLRAEGKHDEADKAFLEFRRRYPNFRITEEMLRRVERR
jgi:ribonuclease E